MLFEAGKSDIYSERTDEYLYFLRDKFTVSKNIAFGSFLFGAVKLTKNADFDKYRYSEYAIEFDAHRSFFLSNGSGVVKT